MTRLQRLCASNVEYLRVQFTNGAMEIIPGPVEFFVDPAVHHGVTVHQAVCLADHEVMVVYREEPNTDGLRAVVRHLIHGPCLHVPGNATEWTQDFSWHGSTSDDPDRNGRKVKGAAKFKKLRACPEQSYIDVESVRTRDDALIRVKAMVFYRLQNIEMMLRETHDPIADFVNALSSDIIEFAGSKTFEEFKLSTDQLNELGSYQQLTSRSKSIGFEITKVVFRGYGAPQQLQRMHDDAIEKRTKLSLDRESQEQEQQVQDMKLQREEQRLATRRQMESDAKRHELALQREVKQHGLELQRLAHEALVKEETEKQLKQLENLVSLKRQLELSADQVTSYVIAKAQGRPEKLIQITGIDGERQVPLVQLQTGV